MPLDSANARKLVEVAEYCGEPSVIIAATQLGTSYSERDKRRVVDEWVDFLGSEPTPIESLRFTTRTPKRLFDSLSGQHQLTSLAVKWGDYEDLSVLGAMRGLRILRLAGAANVKNLAPLAGLPGVQEFQLEGLRGVIDVSPLGEMCGVTDLELGGNWMTPKNVRVNSLAFLAQMPQLERLVLHTLMVDDLDYKTPHQRRRTRDTVVHTLEAHESTRHGNSGHDAFV